MQRWEYKVISLQDGRYSEALTLYEKLAEEFPAVPDFREGVEIAMESIDSGAVRAKLHQLRESVRQ